MKTEHPITPPRELVEQWHEQLRGDPCPVEYATAAISLIATQAARWGADQELEACCKYLYIHYAVPTKQLRDTRRPKELSLKEQALAELELLRGDANAYGLGFDAPAIRRALEALPDV